MDKSCISGQSLLDEISENSNHINHHSNSVESSENFEAVKFKFFRKFAKASGKISKDDLEELLLQKIAESMIYRTQYAQIRVKIQKYEELIQKQRSRIELLDKQYADLEVTHQRILQSMRDRPKDPIEPLKIVRAVSCQVYELTVQNFPEPIVISESPYPKRKTGSRDEQIEEICIESSDDEDESCMTNGHSEKSVTAKQKKFKKSDENSKIVKKILKKCIENGKKLKIAQKSVTEKNSAQDINEKSSNSSMDSKKINISDEEDGLFFKNSNKNVEKSKKYVENQIDKSSPRKNDKIFEKSRKVQNSTENINCTQNSSTNSKISSKKLLNSATLEESTERGLKRKTKTILDMFQKRHKSSKDSIESTSGNAQDAEIINSQTNVSSSENSDCVGNETLASENVAKSLNLIEISPNLFKNSTLDEFSTNPSNSEHFSQKNPSFNGNKISLSTNDNFKIPSSTAKKLHSENPEIIDLVDEITQEIKDRNLNKKFKPGPLCSKLKQQNAIALQPPPDRPETPFQPPRFASNPPSTIKKSNNTHDTSIDSLNLSSYSMFNPSAVKSNNHLVTSTPLKAVNQAPAHVVKRTLDLNFNEKSPKNLPALPKVGPQMLHPRLKQLAPAPIIKVEKVNNGIKITWKIDDLRPSIHADIQSYQIFAYEEQNGSSEEDEGWKLVGDVKALLLPMAVTLKEFSEDQKFHFVVRAVDVHKRFGCYSEAKTWEI